MGLKQNEPPPQAVGKKKKTLNFPTSSKDPVYVTKSELFRRQYKDDSVEHSRRIYIDCVCSSSEHMARVVIDRRIENNSKEPEKWYVVDNQVYLEFNVTHAIDPVDDKPFPLYQRLTSVEHLLAPFKRLLRRWEAAWQLLRGKEVYFCSDILMDHESARKLAEAIIETVDELKDAQ